MANTFGTAEVFRGKVVVDAGAGSGAQAVWMLESGARHVILLDLSHAVDGVKCRLEIPGDWVSSKNRLLNASKGMGSA